MAVLLSACSPSSDRIKLVSGPQGGSWYPLAGALKSIIEAHMKGVSVQVMPGGGIANVLAVERGQAQIGFANSVSTVDALNAQPPFREKATHVCNVATLYPQYFQIITLRSSGLTDPSQFKGRSLAIQKRGNTGEAITAHLLEAFGMSYRDMGRVNYGSYTDSVTLMKDGNADIFTVGTSIPSGAVMDLASARDINVVSIPQDGIERMRELNPGYRPVVIPAGTYPKQDRPAATVGYWTHFIARCDLDDDIVYGILDSIHDGLGDLASIARALKHATPLSMSVDIGVPMHPGAVRWYHDHGVH
ncbi:MAG: TAXI family TRAP transporter solute-binding subunit [Betaproteobacteria bacterium]|nr:TAXI family TRAP transporter solute-binding subunit [Betaproteobacteria bacterium]